MKKKPGFISILSNIIFLAIGIYALYAVLQKQDIGELWQKISNVSLLWPGLVAIVAVIAHVLKAYRWQLLIEPIGKTKLFHVYNALMFGYLVNMGVPHLGEFTRCVGLKKKTGVGVNPLFGTVIAERTVDLFMLFVFTFYIWISEYDRLSDFLMTRFFMPLTGLIDQYKWILAAALVVTLIIAYWLFFVRRRSNMNKVELFIKQIMEGFASARKTNKLSLFILFSILIWTTHFLMGYLFVFAFEGSSDVGIQCGIAMMVAGGIARGLPIQAGGIGVFHVMVATVLILYGVNEDTAGAVAAIYHATTTLHIIFFGLISTIFIYGSNPFRKKDN